VADAQTQFLAFASELGLDTEQWEQDMESDAIRDRVQADLESGTSSTVTGTPSFFVNGVFADVFSSSDVIGAFRDALTSAANANP
jgi:predicted DsbA family dithiol-disulfide isomerase